MDSYGEDSNSDFNATTTTNTICLLHSANNMILAILILMMLLLLCAFSMTRCLLLTSSMQILKTNRENIHNNKNSLVDSACQTSEIEPIIVVLNPDTHDIVLGSTDNNYAN